MSGCVETCSHSCESWEDWAWGIAELWSRPKIDQQLRCLYSEGPFLCLIFLLVSHFSIHPKFFGRYIIIAFSYHLIMITSSRDQVQERVHCSSIHSFVVSSRSRCLSAGYGYPASRKLCTSTSPQQGWLSSPLLTIPDWPNDDELNNFYAASPISSPELSTPSNGDLWNVFEKSFKKSIDPSPSSSPTMDSFGNSPFQSVSQPTWNSNWSPNTSQRPVASYLPLSLIYYPTACEDEAGEHTEFGMDYQPSEIYENPQSPHKAAWGNPKSTRRNSSGSKPERYSSRTKRRGSSESGVSGNKGHQLRSTRQGQRLAYTESDANDDTAKGARTSHNLVEKVCRAFQLGAFHRRFVGAALPRTFISFAPSCVVHKDTNH